MKKNSKICHFQLFFIFDIHLKFDSYNTSLTAGDSVQDLCGWLSPHEVWSSNPSIMWTKYTNTLLQPQHQGDERASQGHAQWTVSVKPKCVALLKKKIKSGKILIARLHQRKWCVYLSVSFCLKGWKNQHSPYSDWMCWLASISFRQSDALATARNTTQQNGNAESSAVTLSNRPLWISASYGYSFIHRFLESHWCCEGNTPETIAGVSSMC